MAQKGYPTNQPPPPPAYYPPPGQQTVIVQQAPTRVVQQPSRGFFGSLGHEINKYGNMIGREIDHAVSDIDKAFVSSSGNNGVLRGLFGQIGHELNMLGRTVGREVDYCANAIDKSLVGSATGNILGLFQTGNVVQLISRKSGHTIQIVQSPTGALVVDGNGAQGESTYNATWTVVNEGNNQVRLHNNNNYLAVVNGNTVVCNMPPGTMHGVETKFQLIQLLGQFIVLESMADRRHHVGILQTGQLKPALATGREEDAQFGVRLIYTPHAGAVKR